MKRFTRCPTCGASVRTENMPDHTRWVHAEVRETASKGHEYLKELEDYMREGYF